MSQILLYVHVLLAVGTVFTSVARLISAEKIATKANKIVPVGVVLVAVSGIGLAVSGGSIVRACISGAVTLSVVIALQSIPISRFQKQSIK